MRPLSISAVLSTITLVGPALAQTDQPRLPVDQGTPGKALFAPPESESFDFVVLGDRTGGPAAGIKVLERAVGMIENLDSDFVMTVGDLVQGYNSHEQWIPQMEEFHRVMDQLVMPWYPVAGNHDVYARPTKPGGHEGAYKQHFGPLYYSFDHRWAHFVVLFSDEAGSFGNPGVDQNMSEAQFNWLREDLRKSRERGNTEMTFVFLHHPRWLPRYAESNWSDVHQLFVDDARPTTVFAGHIHVYRDDPEQNNVKYYTMAVTGGAQGSMRDTAAAHHINLVQVRRNGYKMSYIPVGAILGGDAVLGEEVDEMNDLLRGGWVSLDGAANIAEKPGDSSALDVSITNPTDRPMTFDASFGAPEGWRVSQGDIEGTLAPGESRSFRLDCVAPGLSGVRPDLSIRTTLDYTLKSGLVQPIPLRLTVPVRVTGAASQAAGTPDENSVLALDGESAVRIDFAERLDEYTVECWVRGRRPEGRSAVIAKTESSAYGIYWSDNAQAATPPSALTGTGAGYLSHRPDHEWRWGDWTHVALTFDGKVSRFFVDGALLSELEAEAAATHNRHPLYIGADPDRRGQPNSFFKGAIDEVRVSRVARYDAAFSPARVFAPDDQTAMLLHFDAMYGGIYPDESSSENHGWAVGSPRIVRESR